MVLKNLLGMLLLEQSYKSEKGEYCKNKIQKSDYFLPCCKNHIESGHEENPMKVFLYSFKSFFYPQRWW